MSSNRLTYDPCAYAKTIQESTSQLDYFIFLEKYENKKNCAISDYTNNLEFSLRTDVENELYGLTRPGTLCPALKYDPSKEFRNPNYSPPKMCESIYYITPNNLEKPKDNMLNNKLF
jgi:hypothetical protein